MDLAPVVCASCGTPNEAGRKFCAQCGTGLGVACAELRDAQPGVGSSSAASAAPRMAGGAAAARRRDGQLPNPSAERRLVSVMFADLVGFTTARRGPRRRGDARAADRATSTWRAA